MVVVISLVVCDTCACQCVVVGRGAVSCCRGNVGTCQGHGRTSLPSLIETNLGLGKILG